MKSLGSATGTAVPTPLRVAVGRGESSYPLDLDHGSKTAQIPPTVMFHTANAWEEGDVVKLYGCCMNVVRIPNNAPLTALPLPAHLRRTDDIVTEITVYA